jgi:phosphinothricin acetyltransferase
VVAPLEAADWPAVARIYAAGIAGGNATFEHSVPAWEEWMAARVAEPCLVARVATKDVEGRAQANGGDPAGGVPSAASAEGAPDVIGWAALSPVSGRHVYRGVGAVSIYVDPAHAGRGVGRLLLDALVEASERAGLWTLEAGIFPENAASIALHERCGFRLVGTRRRVGQMQDGRWRDVLLYERRSEAVGRD